MTAKPRTTGRKALAALLALLVITALSTYAYASVSSYSAPDPISFPTDAVVAPNGSVFYVESGGHANAIVRRTSGGTVTEFPIPTADSMPNNLAVSSAGIIWFTEMAGAGKIGRLDPSSGVITEYPVVSSGGEPFDITVAPNGDVWYTLRKANKLGVRFSDGTYGSVSLPSGSKPHGIAADRSGNIWVAATGTSIIYEWTTSETLRSWTLSSGRAPLEIAVDDISNVWFTERDAHRIGRILSSKGTAEYSFSGSSAAATEPWGISVYRRNASGHVTDPVWFSRDGGVGIVTACGIGYEQALDSSFEALGVAADSSSGGWFADIRGNRLGRAYQKDYGLGLSAPALGYYGKTVKLTGNYYIGATPQKSKTLYVMYRQPDSTKWTKWTTVKTGSVGTFSKTVSLKSGSKFTENTAFRTEYRGSSSSASKWSAQECVEVAPSLWAKYSASSLKKGKTLKVTGGLAPAHKGSTIRLEYKKSGVWKTLDTDTLDSKSRYSLSWKPSSKGSYQLRAAYRGDDDHRWRYTTAKTVKVK